MSRRKSRSKSDPVAPDDNDRSSAGRRSIPKPSAAIRTVVTAAVLFQLFAILVSFTSVVEPSEIHARIDSLLGPYLRATHFGAENAPVYLAHGDAVERVHRLQTTNRLIHDSSGTPDEAWTTIEQQGYRGLASSDRMRRWLGLAVTLAENDQSAVIAELFMPLVEADPNINAIRIVRLSNDLDDVNSETETPYVARVIRSAGDVRLVQLRSARLNSPVVPESVGGDSSVE